MQFIVASDGPTWCSKQPFFLADDVRVVTEKHTPAVDMAILAGCDHMVMTVGTFGWWAAYLGADANGGEVVYYDSEFRMEHPCVKGNVVLADYYPERWVAMGALPPADPFMLIKTVGEKCSTYGYFPVLTVAGCIAACKGLGIGILGMPSSPNTNTFCGESDTYLPYGCSFDATSASMQTQDS